MSLSFRSGEKVARDVTRLVDDSLGARERPAIETWLADHPEIAREVALQRSVAHALRFGGPPATESLLSAVETRVARRRVGRTLRTSSPRPSRRLPALAGLAAAAVAAATLAASLAQPPAHQTPSLRVAAQLAFAPATDPAPARRSRTLLDVSYGGITFPNYATRFGAVPTGQRTDRLDDRPALTVFYRLRSGARLSYTIYSGAPIPPPHATRTVAFRRVVLRVVAVDPRLAVVTLVRHGHTCVLAAPAEADVLLALAEAPLQSRSA